MKQLTVENVSEILKECLYQEGEDTSNHLSVEGIKRTFGFNPEKLEKHKESIREMVSQVHPMFQQGWSFLNLCMKNDSETWASDHSSMEELMCLGVATGFMVLPAPRDMWHLLAGGMPYIIVKTT